ncbi:DUF3159 domain-containing protein [Pseudonocardia nigra]|uniref:DUF3159 domain-containing protein n=1 Tax=Pseudonocardia nigra TaxID=1921578 RepID=UPI001C5FF019|nr:DUF3159 domain-containing protein [Pseudonocardia nigra]
MAPPEQPREPSLAQILGGRGGAVDATVPVVAFVLAFTVTDALAWASPIAWGGGTAVLAAVVIGAIRLARGRRPRAVLFGLLGVAVAALVALYTGRAVDFFLVQIVSNAASALAWAISIVVRWPLLGLVVGTALGQRTRWRRDPHLLRGYQRASWVWVGQYLVRLAVFLPLYFADAVVALGIARSVLTWPLVALCVALSWPLLRSALPPGHRGLRHPDAPAEDAERRR